MRRSSQNKHKAHRSSKNAAKYAWYRTSGRREKNKVRKLRKVARRQPNNHQLDKYR